MNSEAPVPAPRSSPYIWVTWLSKLLSGEASCEWAPWFKAHYERGSYSQMPSTFDQAGWHVNHTRLVNRVLDRFGGEGRSVSVEAQNQFTLVGRVATVGGRPDIIAVSGDSVTVCDAKTGQPRISDQVQVMAYMYAVPLAFPEYKGMPIAGLVIYEDHEVAIPPEAVDGPKPTWQPSYTSSATMSQRVRCQVGPSVGSAILRRKTAPSALTTETFTPGQPTTSSYDGPTADARPESLQRSPTVPQTTPAPFPVPFAR